MKIAAKPESVANIRAIVLELADKSRKETGCVSYEVLQNKTEREVFVLYEEWASEAHLDAHNKTPHFHAAVSQAQPFLAKPLDVGRFEIIR